MPTKKGQAGMRDCMAEYRDRQLRSGSKKGPVVQTRDQAIAICLHKSGRPRPKRK